jgi:hypothetical protein
MILLKAINCLIKVNNVNMNKINTSTLLFWLCAFLSGHTQIKEVGKEEFDGLNQNIIIDSGLLEME